jgi:hypothetical protein|tara:strand:+ start:1282 stop:1614 length:333 start_codon:yes stop_codon:yes gene_type:complete
MKWFYTEGKLTVNSEEEDHNFFFKDLMMETSRRSSILKKVKIIFFITFFSLLGLQLFGGGIPSSESLYFYIGYFSTPLLISAVFSGLIFLLLKKNRKSVKKLNTLFKETA